AAAARERRATTLRVDLRHEPDHVHVHRADDEGADARLLPALEAVADAVLAAHEVDRVDHLVGHGHHRALPVALEPELLDLLALPLEARAAEEVLVEVLALRAHAADVEAELLLHRDASPVDVVADHHHHRHGDVEGVEALVPRA